MENVSSTPVRFGKFELDLRTGELRCDGTPVKLQPQPAKLLALLVSHAGEVVTREDLAKHVWGSETFVDFDKGLTFAIRQIRTALEDDVDHPRFLETLQARLPLHSSGEPLGVIWTPDPLRPQDRGCGPDLIILKLTHEFWRNQA